MPKQNQNGDGTRTFQERYEVTSDLQYFSFVSTAGKSHVVTHNYSYTKI